MKEWENKVFTFARQQLQKMEKKDGGDSFGNIHKIEKKDFH